MIILDNAKYHKYKLVDTLNATKMKKKDILSELERVQVEYDPSITSIEEKVLLREWQSKNIETRIDQWTKKKGHSVLFTSPHYSDLEPIEMVWAEVKSKIAKYNSRRTTVNDVGERLYNKLKRLKRDSGKNFVANTVRHVDKVIVKFMAEIELEENKENTNTAVGIDTETESEIYSLYSCRTLSE